MNSYIQRLRRATWSYRQPLTYKPSAEGATVSDLFVWRNSTIWETFFELTDLLSLFEESGNLSRQVTFVFFDNFGCKFLEKTFDLEQNLRFTLALSEIIGNVPSQFGTFAVFHSHTPNSICALGSHIAERGYISYRYRGAPLRSYVHGNLDAIARLPDLSLQMIGGRGLRLRNYNLQYDLSNHGIYELGMVNPTSKKLRIACEALSCDGFISSSQVVDLLPRGAHLFSVFPKHEQLRVVISSRLIMGRPLVFLIQNQTMDVFHG